MIEWLAAGKPKNWKYLGQRAEKDGEREWFSTA
jgi:hypothetical protein